MPRQKQPRAWQLTGEVYAFRTELLKKETKAISILLGHVVPIISDTILDIDIDHEIDFELAEILINKYQLV
jgi:N-acylneuraminate cytidylyltransferase